MRNVIAFIAVVLAAIAFTAYTSHLHPGGSATDLEAQQNAPPPEKPVPAKPEKHALTASDLSAFTRYEKGAIKATMTIANRGSMQILLYPAATPKTVEHIVSLCRQHFYDGLLFHRVVPGFVAQGGDPKSRGVDGASIADVPAEQTGLGQGGSGKTVPLEATLPHTADSIGLARSQDPNSGDSQFYINLSDNHSLDGDYCVFGRIVSGSDVAAKIKQGDKITSFTVS